MQQLFLATSLKTTISFLAKNQKRRERTRNSMELEEMEQSNLALLTPLSTLGREERARNVVRGLGFLGTGRDGAKQFSSFTLMGEGGAQNQKCRERTRIPWNWKRWSKAI